MASAVVDEFSATHALRVSFYARGGGGSAGVAEGATLSVAQAALQPFVRLEPVGGAAGGVDGADDALYTLMMTDPDAPSVADPKFSEFVHWVVVNAKRADFASSGDALVAYHGPSPGPGSGVHRYCLVAYAQPGRIVETELRVGPFSGFPPRRSFKQRAFAAKHGLVPVASLSLLFEHDAEQPYMAAKIQGLAPPDDA